MRVYRDHQKRGAKKRWCIRASLVSAARARRESHSLSPCARPRPRHIRARATNTHQKERKKTDNPRVAARETCRDRYALAPRERPVGSRTKRAAAARIRGGSGRGRSARIDSCYGADLETVVHFGGSHREVRTGKRGGPESWTGTRCGLIHWKRAWGARRRKRGVAARSRAAFGWRVGAHASSSSSRRTTHSRT